MKISRLGEFGLIEQIRKTTPRTAKGVVAGIGDDAAVLRCSSGSQLLATTDMLLEGVHFDLATTDLYSLGWKSAAVNVSDIAAMGGKPRFCLTSLGIPSYLSVEDVREFYRGLNACLKRCGAVLVGGDTCRSLEGFVISVTVLGETAKAGAMTRSGANPGDLLFVTGTLGDSAAGLELMRRNTPAAKKLIEKHLRPIPRFAEGKKLAGIASAMIDVSDGLSSDLAHLCEESSVGAELHADRIPLSKDLRTAKGLKRRPVEYALSGGEDYELLFTVPRSRLQKIRSLRIAATEIGRIVIGKSMSLLDGQGRKKPLRPSGYDHFRAGRIVRKAGR
jgi:thiamine-monophosphate kinase